VEAEDLCLQVRNVASLRLHDLRCRPLWPLLSRSRRISQADAVPRTRPRPETGRPQRGHRDPPGAVRGALAHQPAVFQPTPNGVLTHPAPSGGIDHTEKLRIVTHRHSVGSTLQS
jgi:hypothetical protein